MKAEAAYKADPTQFNKGAVTIEFDRPIGEGYTGKTRTNIENGTPIGEYRWSNSATVGIDAKTGKAYTAYPNMLSGVPKPDPLKIGK